MTKIQQQTIDNRIDVINNLKKFGVAERHRQTLVDNLYWFYKRYSNVKDKDDQKYVQKLY